MEEQEILDAPAKIKHYDKIEAGLAELREKYGNVHYDVSTAAGFDDAKKARAAVREPRYELEKIRKQLKAPALEYSKQIDSEAKRIEGELLKIEQPLDQAIKQEEDRRAEIKAAKEAAELARQQAIQQRMEHIRDFATDAVGLSAAKIEAMRDTLAEFPITVELYEHRAGEAMQLQAGVIAKLDQIHTAALAYEQEQARLAAERAEQDRKRKEEEAAAKAQREAEAAKLATEREALEAEQKRLAAERYAENVRQEAARAEQARKDAAAAAALKKQQEEAAAKLRAQQEEIDRQRREFEAQQAAARRAEEERQEAAERAERERQEAEAQAQREKEEAARLEAERIEQERLAEAARREQEQFEQNGPGDVEIVQTLADHYDVTVGDVMGWLKKFDYTATDEALATANSSN